MDLSANLHWKDPPSQGILRNGEAHLWLVDFQASRELLGYLESLLSADEVTRAGRFRFPIDRERFILSRGALRNILGCYLGRKPQEIEFFYSQQGKPDLAGNTDCRNLSFNVSHAESLALIALSDGRSIGIDVEQVKPDRMMDAVARRFFSSNEFENLLALPEDVRLEAFYNGWTRKEAFLKALGEGLRVPLNAVEVSMKPGEEARLLTIDGDSHAAYHWSVIHLKPLPGHIGALVVKGQLEKLLGYRWRFDPG